VNAADIVNRVLKLGETISHGEDDASLAPPNLTVRVHSDVITRFQRAVLCFREWYLETPDVMYPIACEHWVARPGPSFRRGRAIRDYVCCNSRSQRHHHRSRESVLVLSYLCSVCT